jgi:hypothetical protein
MPEKLYSVSLTKREIQHIHHLLMSEGRIAVDYGNYMQRLSLKGADRFYDMAVDSKILADKFKLGDC